jgi:co-chaperonin GroES (HSP10)
MDIGLTPINDLIICRKEKEYATQGGIILPRPNEKCVLQVLSVGRGVLNKKNGTYNDFDIEEGDYVLFEKRRGHDLSHQGTKYICLGMESILAIYKHQDLVNGKMTVHIDVGEDRMLDEYSTPTSQQINKPTSLGDLL